MIFRPVKFVWLFGKFSKFYLKLGCADSAQYPIARLWQRMMILQVPTSTVGRGTWQMMIAQVNRKWSCDEDGVHMSTKWLPIPRFLRKNEKLFLKRKLKTRKNWHFSGFALSPSLARTLLAPSWVPAGKSLSSKRKYLWYSVYKQDPIMIFIIMIMLELALW